MIRTICLAAAAAFSLATAVAAAESRKTGGQGDASAPIDSGFSGRTPAAHLSDEEAARFAKQIEKELAGKGARVALVFRTGRPRDKLPPGISYTHGAFWAYVPITTAEGKTVQGYAVYNLYHGDGQTLAKDRSYLHQDFPIDFVRGSAVDDVGVIVPTPEMQRRILAAMASPTYAAMHVPSYSLVANPLTAPHQNCNEFMLDVIAAAAWETTDYAQVKSNLAAHFKPTKVKTNLFERVIGPAADSRLKLDDQKGAIRTATYESMADFMTRQSLAKESYVLTRAN